MLDANIHIACSYSFKPIYRVVRSLQAAVKTCVRIDTDGILGIQFMLPEVKGMIGYIDFMVGLGIQTPGTDLRRSHAILPSANQRASNVMVWHFLGAGLGRGGQVR